MMGAVAALAVLAAIPVPAYAATTEATTATKATKIPKNFLIHEKEARANLNAEFPWFVSEATAEPLDLNPCGTEKGVGRTGRSAARTLTHAEPDGSVVEQLVVYGSEARAKQAFAAVRKAVKDCRVHPAGGGLSEVYTATPLKLGAEALKVSYQNYKGSSAKAGGGRAVIVRRGRAVAVYRAYASFFTKADVYPRNLVDAKKMTVKLCAYDSSC